MYCHVAALLHVSFWIGLRPGKIRLWAFVSSNSEKLSCTTFMKHKKAENRNWHYVNRLVPENAKKCGKVHIKYIRIVRKQAWSIQYYRYVWDVSVIKDYDLSLQYHPGKENVVANALSRKLYVNWLSTEDLPEDLCKGLKDLSLEVVPKSFIASLIVQPTLMNRIKETQKGDEDIEKIKENLKEDKAKGFSEDELGTL
jgi:hypothetical protein